MTPSGRQVWEYIRTAIGVRGGLVVLRFWGGFAHWHYRLALDALTSAKIEPAAATWNTSEGSGEIEVRFDAREVTTEQAISVVRSAIERSGLRVNLL